MPWSPQDSVSLGLSFLTFRTRDEEGGLPGAWNSSGHVASPQLRSGSLWRARELSGRQERPE